MISTSYGESEPLDIAEGRSWDTAEIAVLPSALAPEEEPTEPTNNVKVDETTSNKVYD